MTRIRIFLADDHAVVLEGLKALVNTQSDLEVIGEAADGASACEQVVQLRPDVVVLDVSMPGMSGAQAAERLRKECPQVKVLALTVHEDKSYLRQLLEAGASGYVLKRAAAAELIRAIRTVAAGGVYLDPALAGKVVGGFVRKPPGQPASKELELSARETEVVRLIAAGHSNKEIAGRLEISVKTVETYKARSLEKLGLRSRADLALLAATRLAATDVISRALSVSEGDSTREVRLLSSPSTHSPPTSRGEERKMALSKKTPPLAEKPDTMACPKCGHTNDTSGAKTVQVDLRPVLTAEVFAFPDALAEVNCLKCAACDYWICLDYRIELDDNPEIDLNPE